MKSRVSSTVTKRTSNPRPRKYASASERQAAYRDRAPEVCFRAEPKTVETLDRIADTIDRSRAELLLSMTKFALTNHDWERFGLTHKTLPRYEGNPIMATRKTSAKRTPTPAQLAARERFAEMARAGSFKKAGGVKRKANPVGNDRRRAAAEAVREATVQRTNANSAMVWQIIGPGGEVVSGPPGVYPGREGPLAGSATMGNRGWKTKREASAALAHLNRKADEILGLKTNPARKAAGVRGNPVAGRRVKFVCIAPLEYSGAKYGIDERTAVTMKFSEREMKLAHKCYQLPEVVVMNDNFQNFAYHNKVIYMSVAQLRQMLREYA